MVINHKPQNASVFIELKTYVNEASIKKCVYLK